MLPDFIQLALLWLALILLYLRDAWAREETLRMEADDRTPAGYWSKSWLRVTLHEAGSKHWTVRYAVYDGWHLAGWWVYIALLVAVVMPGGAMSLLLKGVLGLFGWAVAAALYTFVFNPRKK